MAAAALLARDAVSRERKVKVLEVGTVILFGALAVWKLLGQVNWSIVDVRLRVDIGLLLIVLVSMALRRPFTLQYAREGTPKEI